MRPKPPKNLRLAEEKKEKEVDAKEGGRATPGKKATRASHPKERKKGGE